MTNKPSPYLLLAMLAALAGTFFVAAGFIAQQPGRPVRIAGFSTTLAGRSIGQRHNAILAARSLDGRTIPPGGVFSFNRAVNSWSADQGYVKALVSYDGDLVRAYGGGVCQTSTTLYNAALMAGLPIIERHPHAFVPGYISPGRDAAVAYPGVDLRFKNNLAFALRISARVKADRIEVTLLGNGHPQVSVRMQTDVISVTAPRRLTRRLSSSSEDTRAPYIHSAGLTGCRVVTYRLLNDHHGRTTREYLGDDSYRCMDRIVAMAGPTVQ